MLDLTTVLYLCSIFVFAGTVKGSVGLGLPTTSIALLTLQFDPRTAIVFTLMPMLITNAWQVISMGEVIRTARTYRVFAATLFVSLAAVFFVTRTAPDQFLFAFMGLSILAFVLINASRWAPRIRDEQDKRFQAAAGVFSGIFGGISSIWAPPMVMYLAARQTPKDDFVRATGLLIFIGSVPLAIGYWAQGYLDRSGFITSLALLVPTLIGFTIGAAIRNRVSEKTFRRLLFTVFFFMGLNLLRRAFF